MRTFRRAAHQRRSVELYLLLALVAVGVVLGIWQARAVQGSRRTGAEEFIAVVARPVQVMFVRAAGGVSALGSARSLAGENRRLRAELAEVRTRDRTMVEVAEENRRLRRLLRLKAAVPYRTVAARVIAVDAGGWSEQVVLDKGRADGVDSERGVISESGLVGQVFAVTAHTASVVLVTDRNSSVAAMVGRSRTAGIVKGTGHGTCVMTYLPPQADVRVGDRILTSGRGGIFPKGLPIGTVTKVERHDFNSTTSATLRAGAVQDRLEEVLVMDR